MLNYMKQHIIEIRNIKFTLVIGLGYWKDNYINVAEGIGGIVHNIIFPFVKIQYGYLIVEKEDIIT